MRSEDVSQASMLDLFRLEAEEQMQLLTAGLLALERDPTAPVHLEACMRAAHSVKGAARIAGVEAGVRLAHTMESCFVAAQQRRVRLEKALVDALLRAVDLLRRIAQTSDGVADGSGDATDVVQCVTALEGALERVSSAAPRTCDSESGASVARVAGGQAADPERGPGGGEEGAGTLGRSAPTVEVDNRVLRVTAQHLNHLLGLAGESLVESRRIKPFADSLLRLKRQHSELTQALRRLRETVGADGIAGRAEDALAEVERHASDCRKRVAQHLADLDGFERCVTNLSTRLYDGALACRMRPFSDLTRGMPRMVRDLARQLRKQVRLEVEDQAVEVDREILQKLEAPIGHLLRNAVDHGIEPPEARIAAGKDAEGIVRIKVCHLAGRLNVLVSDDGAGIDLQRLRAAVLRRGLASDDIVTRLTSAELYDFLLLPGFTLATSVTDISGRGVGLDAVKTLMQQLRGSLRISSQPHHGMRFEMQLPLTLSLIRALLVEVGGEPYAIPLASMVRALKVPNEQIALLQGRPHVALDGRRIGLIGAYQLLESAPPPPGAQCSVVVVGGGEQSYGLVVDRLLGERELVVQPLDPRLGKLRNISAGALMEDGSPVLIIDSEDLLRSIERFVASDGVGAVTIRASGASSRRRRVLVVDDSLTVRELQRKLLSNGGYDVEVAVDGIDGWNAVRSQPFDLVISDVDMPRMDGIEFVTLIKHDARLRSLPVMIVSYKDRPEDRQRGLEAGADYYLPKSSFHDTALIEAVSELIGGAMP